MSKECVTVTLSSVEFATRLSISLKYNIKVLRLEFFHYVVPYKFDGTDEAYNKTVEYDPPSRLK